jgi:hypothetical protein
METGGRAMIWADRVAIGLLALAAILFAGIYAVQQARQEAMIEPLEAAAQRGMCDVAKSYAAVFPDQTDRVENLCRN